MIGSELKNKLLSEIVFTAAKSSGSGGQNVNKVNTKVELRFNILKSEYLSDSEKAILLYKLKNRVNNRKELILVSEESRSQLKNKQLVTERFFTMLTLALTQLKTRKPSKPTKASVERRLKLKKKRSEKKSMRRLLGT